MTNEELLAHQQRAELNARVKAMIDRSRKAEGFFESPTCPGWIFVEGPHTSPGGIRYVQQPQVFAVPVAMLLQWMSAQLAGMSGSVHAAPLPAEQPVIKGVAL